MLVPIAFAFALAPLGDRPALGSAAPPLALEHRLQWPEGAPRDWEGLRGKVVVLEFWGTWCPPCVAAIPHLNELAQALADEPVRFVSISFEEPEPIERFLAQRAMRGWIGLDTDKSVSNALGIEAYPATVLVDAQGRIAAYTTPQAVTTKVLRAMLAGEAPPLAVRDATRAGGEDEDEDPNALEPLFEVSIRPSIGAVALVRTEPRGRFEVLGQPLTTILPLAYGSSWSRMRVDVELPGERYDVRVRVPAGMQERLLHEALESSFGFSTRRAREEVEAFVLRAGPEAGQRLRPARSEEWSSYTSGAGFGAGGCSVAALARVLEAKLGAPVFDESGIEGLYDFDLRVDGSSASELAKELDARCGLGFVAVRREVEVLFVEPPRGVESPLPPREDY